jgi:hypothetical protein
MAEYNDLDTPSSSETPPPRPSGSGNRTFMALIGILGVIFLIVLGLMLAYLLYIRPRQAGLTPGSAEAKSLEATATALVATRDALVLAKTQNPTGLQPLSTAQPAASGGVTPTGVLVIPTQVAVTGSTAPAGYPPPAGEALASATAQPPSAAGAGPTAAVAGQTQAAVQATATATRVRTNTGPTITPVLIDARTATVASLLTQAAKNLQPTTAAGGAVTASTQGAAGAATPTATATALPETGFAEEAGIPGLLGIAIGLIVVIFIARGLRTKTS